MSFLKDRRTPRVSEWCVVGSRTASDWIRKTYRPGISSWECGEWTGALFETGGGVSGSGIGTGEWSWAEFRTGWVTGCWERSWTTWDWI